MRKVFARRIVIDHSQGNISVDGVVLPWLIAEQGPQVSADPPGVIEVSVPLLVNGTVEVRNLPAPRVYDSELGDVGAYARELVRSQLAEAYPWLEAAR